MRCIVCIVLWALCLVAWECTAEGLGTGLEGQRAGGAPTVTTAPQSGPPGALNGQQDSGQVKVEDSPGSEEDGDADEEEDTEDHSPGGPQEKPQSGANLAQDAVPKTTTTTTNKEPLGAVLTPPEGNGRSSTTQVQSTLDAPNNGQKPNLQTHNGDGSARTEAGGVKTTAHAPEPQNKASSPTEEKTTTTTAAGQTLSGPQEDKVKEQPTTPKDGGATDLKIADAAAEAITSTTNAPTNTLPKESKIQQSINNKDSSSSISLLFALAILATFALIPVATV